MPNGAGGGGGGGIVGVGNSFTGPAQALELVGDHAYAYSGEVGSSSAGPTHLKFTSGNYYFVGRLTCNGALKVADPNVGRTTIFTLTLNGGIVALIKVDSVEEDQPSTAYNDIIIPPYTEVEVTATSDTTTADRLTTVLMSGRIYRG